eukprot:1150463-Pelagomonas_calceolata.AAC.2
MKQSALQAAVSKLILLISFTGQHQAKGPTHQDDPRGPFTCRGHTLHCMAWHGMHIQQGPTWYAHAAASMHIQQGPA